jgi:hypothetical protein
MLNSELYQKSFRLGPPRIYDLSRVGMSARVLPPGTDNCLHHQDPDLTTWNTASLPQRQNEGYVIDANPPLKGSLLQAGPQSLGELPVPGLFNG